MLTVRTCAVALFFSTPLLAGCADTAHPEDVAATTVALTRAGVAAGDAGAAQTQPTGVSVAGLYLSNWTSAQSIWMASKLAPTDTSAYGPRLAEMRIANDWTTNQIVDYSDFFRDETHSVKYDQAHAFDSQAYLDEQGILRTQYLDYSGNSMPLTVTKAFAMVPNQAFTVATVTFTNAGSSSIDYNLLDQLRVNNKTLGGSNVPLHGWFDSTRNALFVDMSGSGQFYVGFASLQAVAGHQVASDSTSSVSSVDAAGWFTFDASGTVNGNDDEVNPDVSVAFEDRFTVPAAGSVSRSFALTIQGTLAEAENAIDAVESEPAAYWFAQTQAAYTGWLTGAGAKTVAFDDTGLDLAYSRALVALKNSVNPSSGAMPSTTNPFDYSYDVWARDSAVTAIALDMAGLTAEAGTFWTWLAARQSSDGRFETRFNLWDSSYVPFVNPEDDTIGIFLMGVRNHYRVTGDEAFLTALWPAFQRSANYLWSSLGTNSYGLGAEDFSIWEESYEYGVFSQAAYVAGLDAAQYVAVAMGRQDLADDYAGAASQIRTTLQRDDTWYPAGLWNIDQGYYDRAVNSNGTARTTVDGSSDALLVFGIVDAASSRARSHVSQILAMDGHDGYGVSRYPGDTYYSTSIYSPGGDETGSDSPDWPQLSAYLAIDAAYQGSSTLALDYLTWIVSRSFAGYMPQGEAVSRTLLTPVVSSGVEPVTAAWFVMAALVATHQADLRVVSPSSNVGAMKTIGVSGSVAGDLPQWDGVPYFVDEIGDSLSGSGDTDIARVYLSNDANNLYVRIVNASHHLSTYQQLPKFGVQLYSEDLKHETGLASSAIALNGGALSRPMQYLVSRTSDVSSFLQEDVQGAAWTSSHSVGTVIDPQWDPATGNIEMVVPLGTISSAGYGSSEDWANMVLVLSRQASAAAAWQDDDQIAVHYRVTSPGDAWYYGNVD